MLRTCVRYGLQPRVNPLRKCPQSGGKADVSRLLFDRISYLEKECDEKNRLLMERTSELQSRTGGRIIAVATVIGTWWIAIVFCDNYLKYLKTK